MGHNMGKYLGHLFKYINKQPAIFPLLLPVQYPSPQNLWAARPSSISHSHKILKTEAYIQRSMKLPAKPSLVFLHTDQQTLQFSGLCHIYSVKELLSSLYLSTSFYPSVTVSLFLDTCFTKLQNGMNSRS